MEMPYAALGERGFEGFLDEWRVRHVQKQFQYLFVWRLCSNSI